MKKKQFTASLVLLAIASTIAVSIGLAVLSKTKTQVNYCQRDCSANSQPKTETVELFIERDDDGSRYTCQLSCRLDNSFDGSVTLIYMGIIGFFVFFTCVSVILMRKAKRNTQKKDCICHAHSTISKYSLSCLVLLSKNTLDLLRKPTVHF